MTIKKQQDGEQLLVRITGRIDTNTAPEFQQEVKPELERVGKLVLDFEQVDYISSAGLRVLLDLEQTMEEKDGSMEVCNVNSVIRDVFDITGFLDILTIV